MDLAPLHFSNALREMQRAMTIFDQPFFKGGFVGDLLGTQDNSVTNSFVRYPVSDMVETPESFELSMELPGYDKKNIKIDMVDNRTLVISGSIEQEYEKSDTPSSKENKIDGDKKQQVFKKEDSSQVVQHEPSDYHWWVNERVSGSFTRSFSLPNAVNPDDIKASYNNGVLKVNIPKIEDSKSKHNIDID